MVCPNQCLNPRACTLCEGVNFIGHTKSFLTTFAGHPRAGVQQLEFGRLPSQQDLDDDDDEASESSH